MSYLFQLQNYLSDHSDALGGDTVQITENRSLAVLSTMRLPGNASIVVSPRTESTVMLCLRFCVESGVPHYIIGKGSNTLFLSDKYDGILIANDGFNELSFDGESVVVGAGVPMRKLCRAAAERGLSGLEELYGIPGSVGGAVAMNSGAFGKSVADLSPQIIYVTPNSSVTSAANDVIYGYRDTLFLRNDLAFITKVSFRLVKGDRDAIRLRMDAYYEKRCAAQPLNYPSLGSIYKRPSVGFAGKYIEDCGLKGCAVGGAAVSEKHAGFIINKGGATGDDVLHLMQHVEDCVYRRFGVTLEREIRTVK